MPTDLLALFADLSAESDDLMDILRPLAERQWQTPTPSQGWTVKDQVSHLAHFDEAATLSISDPARFTATTAELMAHGQDVTEQVARTHHDDEGADLLAWFGRSRSALLAAFAQADPATRLPWYGPPMSVASSATARLMETWAHSQDVVDALGLTRQPTMRLRHVAHLGVSTIGWSFAINDLPPPTAALHVALRAPDGSTWTWGPPDADDRITGPALDFCLLTTQRRHRDDLAIEATGATARSYVRIAQAFAGPPGNGRPPHLGRTR